LSNIISLDQVHISVILLYPHLKYLFSLSLKEKLPSIASVLTFELAMLSIVSTIKDNAINNIITHITVDISNSTNVNADLLIKDFTIFES
jgi:hypothetical protein